MTDKVILHFYTNAIFLNSNAADGSAMHTAQNKLNFTASKHIFTKEQKKAKNKAALLKLFRSFLYASTGI